MVRHRLAKLLVANITVKKISAPQNVSGPKIQAFKTRHSSKMARFNPMASFLIVLVLVTQTSAWRGGYIQLINATPYEWKLNETTSSGMHWDFPKTVSSGKFKIQTFLLVPSNLHRIFPRATFRIHNLPLQELRQRDLHSRKRTQAHVLHYKIRPSTTPHHQSPHRCPILPPSTVTPSPTRLATTSRFRARQQRALHARWVKRSILILHAAARLDASFARHPVSACPARALFARLKRRSYVNSEPLPHSQPAVPYAVTITNKISLFPTLHRRTAFHHVTRFLPQRLFRREV